MSILDDIVNVKRREVASLRRRFNRASFGDFPAFHLPTMGFAGTLKTVGRENPPAIIAEIKRASPSAGALMPHGDAAELAMAYASNGAAALSVLTDTRFFHGSVDDLASVRDKVSLPLLRKDFFIDEYQVLESRARGADAILLIAAILERTAMRDLHALTVELGMDALVEVHGIADLDKVDFAVTTLVGINNRNLGDMTVDTGTTEMISRHIPPGVAFVSESGLRNADDVRMALETGASAVLMGECFMKCEDPGLQLKEIIGDLRQG